MRHLLSVSLVCLLGALTVASANAKTLHVPDQYPTIVAAVAAANPGDSIRVDEGLYANEKTVDPLHTDPSDPFHFISGIVIATPNIEIVGEEGVVIDGAAFGGAAAFTTNGVLVYATGVTIRGLTITNWGTGIAESGPAGTRIQANTVNACGVAINCSTGTNEGADPPMPMPSRTTVDHNIVTGNGTGILLDNGQNVNVTQNVVNGNGVDGGGSAIDLEFSIDCLVTHNAVCNNQVSGIDLEFAENITVGHNSVDGNGLAYPLADPFAFTFGIHVGAATTNCTLVHNEVNENSQDGIFIDSQFALNNLLSLNTALHNGRYDLDDQSGGTNFLLLNKFGTVSKP
jgi:parallel beta-helix repeat protein